MKVACGECFDWAYANLPRARGKLVHAMVRDPWKGERRYPHAWIERGGRVFDWQTAQGLGPGPGGWLHGKFYEVYQPEAIVKYDFDESRTAALRSGHYGPW